MDSGFFKNLNVMERGLALLWFDRLNLSDRFRVSVVLDYLNNKAFAIESERPEDSPANGLNYELLCEGMKTEMAFIVAGSSIDTTNYKDIDLFAIPREHLTRSWIDGCERMRPNNAFSRNIQNDSRMLPDRVDASEYDIFPDHEYSQFLTQKVCTGPAHIVQALDNDASLTIFNQLCTKDELRGQPRVISRMFQNIRYEDIPINESIIDRYIYGAPISISLFYEKEGFEAPRRNHINDLIEPEEDLGAEQIIKFNKDRGTKFLVLSRQYEQ